MTNHDARASNLGRNGRDLLAIPVCGYSPVPNDPTVPLCNQPAAAHITPLDRGKEASWTIFACDQHATLALADTWDWHPIAPACTTRGHTWIRGTAFHHSSCTLERTRTEIADR